MNFQRSIILCACAGFALAGFFIVWPQLEKGAEAEHRVEFNRDIRPIFNQHCISCHGGVKKQGEVSFIYREEALGKGKSGRPTVVPGRPGASELIARVTSTDPEIRMPYHAPPLQPQQVELLKQWINEGAQWEDHWAFMPPKPQRPPQVKQSGWVRQPLDRFTLARLEQEGLQPSAEASKPELLRRLSFDLIGLPPTPQELADFLADSSTEAYERQVDRLLTSLHYGERWAAVWLDLARYADSKGYEKDTNRLMWHYRDWVIDAFNRNLPYDRFVMTQLAGDLLANPTLEDRIATAFQRQTPANDEGGTDDEEFRVAAVMDRVATTWSVLNGVTINCVQCHSHPYDPIHHEEYYKFLAFYNTSQDADRRDDEPMLRVPEDGALRSEVAELEQRRNQLLREMVAEGRSLAERTSWIPLPVETGAIDERPAIEAYIATLRIEASGKNPEAKFVKQFITELEARAQATRVRAPPALQVTDGVARAPGTVSFLSVYQLLTRPVPAIVTALRIEVPPIDAKKAHHTPEEGFIVDRVDASVVSARGDKQQIAFRYFAPDSEEVLAAHHEARQRSTRKKASEGEGDTRAFAADPKLFQKRWLIAIPEKPLSLDPGSRLEVRLWHLRVTDGKPTVVRQVRFDTTQDARWTAFAKGPKLQAQLDELAGVEERLAEIPSVPVPVMAEQPAAERRQTLVFERGNFLNKIGLPLEPDMPAIFPELPDRASRDRLAMARWFFAPGQPLTARVAVNRYWEQLFGTGIVETLEDFGSSGLPPSHPDLLDWLALHFQNDLHWDMKALLRELVTSATYRQSARVTPDLLQKDPRNQLLARGPQQRLTAEMVRDQALLASGLLTPTIGGPSVMPPQPAGVWMTANSNSQWTDAKGPDRYRRAVYTFIKRSSVYPSFQTFDAADHVVSLARRIPTNTPLQALVTLNDPVYYEAAEALARQMRRAVLSNGSDALDARLNAGARRVLSRDFLPEELATLRAFYEDARRMSAASTGDPERLALVATAGVVLNLDAALTR